jgi:hypothetical protein
VPLVGATARESCEAVAARAGHPLPTNPNGVKSADRCSSDIIRGQPTIGTVGGTSADYLTARIARDHPDILQGPIAMSKPVVFLLALTVLLVLLCLTDIPWRWGVGNRVARREAARIEAMHRGMPHLPRAGP